MECGSASWILHVNFEIPVGRRCRRIQSSFLPSSFFASSSQPFLHFFGFGRQVAAAVQVDEEEIVRFAPPPSSSNGPTTTAAAAASGSGGGLGRYSQQLVGREGGREIDLSPLQGGANLMKLGCQNAR